MFISINQIRKSLEHLKAVHPFYGITFLVCKRERLPIGSTIELSLDAKNKEFLEQYYKPNESSRYYYQVFRTSDPSDRWNRPDYASSGLQSVNTRTFGDAFIHEKNTRIWGWKDNYVDVLKAHLYRKKPIPAFHLAVWLYLNQEWVADSTGEDIVSTFTTEFGITDEEKHELFDLSITDSLPQDQLFQANVISWEELREVIGSPPDIEPEEDSVVQLEMHLENVRGFVAKHIIPVKPLTLLVGENSSGKSTFLATLSAVCNSPAYPFSPRFNDPPYNLGGYDTIATNKGGDNGRAEYFCVGHKIEGKFKQRSAEVVAKYTNDRGQVELSSFKVTSPIGEFHLRLEGFENDRYTARLTPSNKSKKSIEFEIDRSRADYAKNDLPTFLFKNFVDFQLHGDSGKRRAAVDVDYINQIVKISSFVNPKRSLSIAPIRTKPSRTYDQVSDEYNPEGTHIPYLLARVLNEKNPSKQKRAVIAALAQFGKESGMFSEIGVKPLGDNIGDPFQIMVTASKQPANLLDVGYGVSQALPIIVQSVLLDTPRLLLLQQPEVHLHPKAQAALGSFFANLVAEGDKEFVIETHSDFIIDRIRQEVASGRLNYDAVGILFFDKVGIETKVHPLTLDSMGNILGAPPSYREFFLREEINLIARTGGYD